MISPKYVYSHFRNIKDSFLLESMNGPFNVARYSFIGFDPFITIKAKEDKVFINEKVYKGNPFFILRDVLKRAKKHKEFKGCFGYFGYNLAWFIEELPRKNIDDIGMPDLYLIFPKNLIVFDHKLKTMEILSLDENEIRKEIKKREVPFSKEIKRGRFISNFTKKGYIEMVKRAKGYIKAGDIYQANLSQRLCCELDMDPWFVYKNLSSINPSPFSAFLNLGDSFIVSSSPERLIKVSDGIIETRPIAGTRPRGKGRIDKKLEKELILSEKERAEHIMLVDLERNDIGKVCKYGTVIPDELMTIERYSHVMHIVSNIKGILKDDKDFIDCIIAGFPGGTITGVPKKRCMEIIEELEPTFRGPYTGSIGYIDFQGKMDLNIIIRTIIIKNSKAYIQAGGGIVSDSDPELEYYETLHKAEALILSITKYVD
ncbi:MAG: anthranilate synthase component I family protein [bacterium]